MAGEGEFDFIARRLAPLTQGHTGAYGLKDDGAILAPPSGCSFAVTSDTLVEGVHFPGGEDPFKAGWKALAANVSDLVAMGAEPKLYVLNIVWPKGGFETRVERFVKGLAEAQAAFGMALVGGDTTSAEGPWTLSITAFGAVQGTRTPRRGGAKPGDVLLVSNFIGDPYLGLQQRLGLTLFNVPAHSSFVEQRFATPSPPVALFSKLHHYATAAIDVSDGLLADIGHILDASGLSATIDLSDLPLSAAALDWVSRQEDEMAARLSLATGGDDYEIVAAVPENFVRRFSSECAQIGVRITRLARLEAGSGLDVSFNATPVQTGALGFTHF
jgi:thiamine-monophosphate kinase